MGAAVNTSLVREIRQDQAKMVWLLLGTIAFAAACSWLVTGDFSGIPRGALAPYAGWAGIVFCGAGAVVAIWRLLKPQTIELSPEGICYAHDRNRLVPWIAVTAVAEQEVRGQKFLTLMLNPLLADGRQRLGLSAQTLKISYDELLQLIRAYAEAHGRGNIPRDISGPAAAKRPIQFGRRVERQ